MKLKLLFFIYFLLQHLISFSQTPPEITQIIEEITQESDDEINLEQLTEDLIYFYENPINLNFSNSSDLLKLHLVSELQIYYLSSYLDRYGQMLSIYELRFVKNWDMILIEKLLPFLKVEHIEYERKYTLNQVFTYGRNQVFLRGEKILETQKGYKEIFEDGEKLPTSYQGNNLKLYTKYKFHYSNKIFWGITAEKDAGESFFQKEQKQGFDFYSAHFQINDIGIFKTLIIGDYSVQFGEGLNIWTGYNSGKSDFNILNIKKYGEKIKKYSSVNENNFFRGIATNFKFKNFEFCNFISHKKTDANILEKDTLDEENIFFSSLQNTGFHRTNNEIADKNAIKTSIFGSQISFKKNTFKAELNFSHYFFNSNFEKEIKPYNKFELHRNKNTNLSFNTAFILNNSLFFSEVAISENHGKALLLGVSTYLNTFITLSFLHRNYQKNYQNLYSNAFGENTRNANEKGNYLALEILPFGKWKILTYYDSYQFDWLKFNIESPSYGNDFLIKVIYNYSRNVKMYAQWKQKNQFQNFKNDDIVIDKIYEKKSQKWRYHIEYKFNFTDFNLIFKNRIELSNYSFEKNENGYLTYQDIIFRFEKQNLDLIFRYLVFDTKTYQSRIYTYENDLLYQFSIPAFYDKGTRFYLMIKYKILKNLKIECKFAQTFFENKKTIGSYLDEINGQTKSTIKCQIVWKF